MGISILWNVGRCLTSSSRGTSTWSVQYTFSSERSISCCVIGLEGSFYRTFFRLMGVLCFLIGILMRRLHYGAGSYSSQCVIYSKARTVLLTTTRGRELRFYLTISMRRSGSF